MDMNRIYTTLLTTLCISTTCYADLSLQQRYQAAVKDAEIATTDEISRNLAAISPTNTELHWNADKTAVLALTWTGWNGYDNEVGNHMTLQREIWVTPVPYLQQFCQAQNRSDQALALRLEQLLGLPPHNGKNRFVEVWVKPSDLFRPTPDPAITDHEAELDFPMAVGMTVSQQHKKWINNLKSSSYGENGYPWTRLGYTYDWGNPDSEIGLSEYVVQQGADVTINSVNSLQQYCAR